MSELFELGVAEIATRVRSRELSAVELVQALLARIDATEPRVQAWEAVDAERALAAAAACDANASTGAGSLAGVPVGVKAIYNVAGLPTTAGWSVAASPPAANDSRTVATVRGAGAIILGHTVSTPFAMSDPPRTRNPWDPARTPGGSSSGSAAAVAARQVPAALGSQTAGSILRPAAYCGVVGLKPTFGRVSRRGIVPLSWSLDHPGPIARSVQDAALLLEALAIYDVRDTSSRRPASEEDLRLAEAPPPPRLGVVRDVLERSEPEVRAHTEGVIAQLERAGAQVRAVPLPEPFELWLAVHQVIMLSEAAAAHADLHARRAAEYPPKLRANVEVGQLIPAPAYLRAQQWRRRIRRRAMRMFEGLDCLVMPTASNVAPEPSTTGDTRFQALWSLVGVPALTLPSGLSADRLPFGLQLVAAPWQEATLLRAGRWCEQQLGPLPAPF
jgi:aspartyl-tRNA(Asn)/glutamyl-tRNA(Gln) amidotransferase subunit A